MKKIVRLTERDLTRIVKRAIMEMEEDKSSEDGENFRLQPEHLIKSLNHNVKKFITSEDLDKEESFKRLVYFIQRDIKPILNKAEEKGLWTDEEIDYVIRYLKIAYNYDYYSGKELPPPIKLTESNLTKLVKRIIKESMYDELYGDPDDPEGSNYEEITARKLCNLMIDLVYSDLPAGHYTKEQALKILNNHMNRAQSRYDKNLLSKEEYDKISECYDEMVSEVENSDSSEDEDDDDGFYHGGEGPGGRW